MPHSTYLPSNSRISTLNSGSDRDRRKSMATTTSAGSPNGTMNGVHNTRDERYTLPSQISNARNRNSSPVLPEGFAELLRSGGNIDEVLGARQAGDRGSVSSRQPSDQLSMIGHYNSPDKRMTQYYEQQFQYKDNVMRPTQDRVHRESPVVAELKTNVIIKDEFTLVTDLSYHLAQRYTKPDSCIMIKVDHSACLALGGTFDPCYFMTITAAPSHMGPATNKRNAALIQAFMADILSVPADRGIVKFERIEPSDFAMNGTTMLGEIERLDKGAQSQDNSNAVKRAMTNASRKSVPAFTKSTPKTDADAAIPESIVKSNGTTPLPIKRRSTANEATLPTPPLLDVFELPATDAERPSTSHGASYAAENGLRMNGVSKEDLIGAAALTPNGRPKTFAGQTTVQDLVKPEPLPKMQRQSSHPAQTRSQHVSGIAVKTADPKKANNPISPKPAPSTTISPPSAIKSTTSQTQTRPKDTYLDGVPASRTNGVRKDDKADPKVDAKAAEKERERERSAAKKDPEANTAKRRSTVTAIPRMPAPPPVPQSKEWKEPKVGKRKSFLSAFRRVAAA